MPTTRCRNFVPGDIYKIDVEIWPTSAVLPAGYRLMLTLMGKDFQFPGYLGASFTIHPHDRDKVEFKGVNRILTGGANPSQLVLPHIPRP